MGMEASYYMPFLYTDFTLCPKTVSVYIDLLTFGTSVDDNKVKKVIIYDQKIYHWYRRTAVVYG